METNESVVEQATSRVPNTEAQNADSESKLKLICEFADEMKARDITVLDVRGQTIVADFFITCSGTSVTHIQSIAEGVQDKMREQARLRAKPEGDARSFWVILDYSDIIVHIFDEETREFYDLERLWSDAKISYFGSERSEPKEASESTAELGIDSSSVAEA
jgi:ribosome-associated protein